MFSWLLVFVLSISVWSISGQDVCSGPSRLYCMNVSSAKTCNALEKCLTYWKSSRWVHIQTDLSAKCTYCLSAARSMSDARSLMLCKISNPQCDDLISSWKLNNKNENSSTVFCNVVDMCRSHTYLGNLYFGSVCEDCKKIVQDVRALVSDNATSAAITDKMERYVCNGTPEMFRDYCRETVRVHIPALLHLIEIHISPDDICALLGLCKRDHLVISLIDLLPEVLEKSEVASTHTKCSKAGMFSWINRPDTRNHLLFTSRDALLKKPSEFSEIPSCGQCISVLEQIRQTLNSPAIRDEIKQEIDLKVCSTLPSFLKQACKNAVNVHFDDIITSLNQADLSEVCATFGMCATDSDCLNSRQRPAGVIPQTPFQPAIPVPGACHLCELVLHKLMDMLVNNRTEASITAALEYICEHIPSGYKDKCEKFVVQYGAEIVEAVVEGTAPKLFCMTIGLCSEPMAVEMPKPEPLKLNYCDTCKIFVTVVQQQLQQNQTVEGLENTMKRLCNVLPGSYGDECKTLVDIYLPTVIDYVAKSMSPEEICQEIKLCPTESELIATHSDIRVLCNSQTLDQLCSSLELAAMCGKTYACQQYHTTRYLNDTMKSSLPSLTDCSICAELVRRWRLSKDLYGRVLENGHSCEGYVNPDDRTLCQSIVDKRFMIQRKLRNSELSVEEICKQSDSCLPNSPATHVTKIPEVLQSLDHMAHICRIDYKKLCASKRLIELCGKANFCRAVGLPSNPCLWDTSYYCQSEERARLCGSGAIEHCRSLGFNIEQPVVAQHIPDVGRNPCTWGPAFWCSSEENARSCGSYAVEHCLRKAEKRETFMVN